MSNPFSKVPQLKVPIYRDKVFDFQDLTRYIQNHKDYNPKNKWKTFEIVSKFHEIVLMVKFILAKEDKKLFKCHKDLEDDLENTRKKYFHFYRIAKNAAQLARYEQLVLDEKAIEKFEQAYEFFLNEFRKRKDDA
jgi:hypothetical protein